MSVIASIVQAAAGAGHINELPFPPFVFGLVVLILFIVLGFVTFSFRDVANRHIEKAEAYAREHGAEEH